MSVVSAPSVADMVEDLQNAPIDDIVFNTLPEETDQINEGRSGNETSVEENGWQSVTNCVKFVRAFQNVEKNYAATLPEMTLAIAQYKEELADAIAGVDKA
ncbi:hypothetical protein EMCRGX_G022314 [Ephydatia muelleri]